MALWDFRIKETHAGISIAVKNIFIKYWVIHNAYLLVAYAVFSSQMTCCLHVIPDLFEEVLCWWQIVMRRLPPTWTSETFVDQISPIPDHDYFYFVPGDQSDVRSAPVCYVTCVS